MINLHQISQFFKKSLNSHKAIFSLIISYVFYQLDSQKNKKNTIAV